MIKRYVIISDTQIPYHDQRAVNAVINFIKVTKPDEVVHIGDLMDYPGPSRWSKGGRGEFETDIFEHSEIAKRKFLAPLRDAYDGPVGVIEGNHDERPRVYLEKYAPALSGKQEFNFDALLDFESYEIRVLPETYKFAPGWIMTHGHRQGIRLTNIPGNTATNAAKRLGVSVIMGHTHRMGIGGHTIGHNGTVVQRLTGVEVGNLMDYKHASQQYLKGGTANWQKGFAVVDVDGKCVAPQLVFIEGNKFIVDGKTYSV